TALSLTSIKSIAVDDNATVKLTAAQIGQLGAMSAAATKTLTVNTTVAGNAALGTKAPGVAVQVEDTVENILAAGDALATVTVTLGVVNVANAVSALAASTGSLTYELQDTAANLALAPAAAFNKATKITATDSATASQAAEIAATDLAATSFTATTTNLVYTVTDTAEALAGTVSGLGNAGTVTATTNATGAEAKAINVAALTGVVTTTAVYAVTDTVANLNTLVGNGDALTALNGASSVTFSNAVTNVTELKAINTALNGASGGLTAVASGYELTEQRTDVLGNLPEANAAGKVTVTDVLTVAQANSIEALSNTGANSYTLSDSVDALLASTAAVKTGASAVQTSTTPLSVSQMNQLVSAYGTDDLSDLTLAVAGTVAELATLTAESLAEIKTAGGGGSLSVTGGTSASLAEVVALKTTLGTIYASLLPAYSVTDSQSNLTTGVADATNLVVLNSAASVTLTGAATVDQVADINTKLTAESGGLTAIAAGYDLNDSAANLAAATASSVVDGASTITVSGGATVAQVSAVATYFTVTGPDAGYGTDIVYSLVDSSAAVLAATSAVKDGSTAISINNAVSVADALLLSALTKFDDSYTLSTTVSLLNDANADSPAGSKAILTGATGVSLTDNVTTLDSSAGDTAMTLATTTTVNDSLAALTASSSSLKS
ncbi:MAG: hypothetical protein HN804_07130, partial [Oceanospirillaceae bacterium]|nr:hypothetical protein [Oceanospirillaceae bacterium]